MKPRVILVNDRMQQGRRQHPRAGVEEHEGFGTGTGAGTVATSRPSAFARRSTT